MDRKKLALTMAVATTLTVSSVSSSLPTVVYAQENTNAIENEENVVENGSEEVTLPEETLPEEENLPATETEDVESSEEDGNVVEQNTEVTSVQEERTNIESVSATADNNLSGNCGATENDNVTWELKQNNTDTANPTYTLTIGGSGNMVDYAHHSDSKHTIENGGCTTKNCDYNRPWSSYISNITAIVIEDNVTKIGNCAFRSMSSVSSVSIGHSVSVIGENAFKDCEALTEIEIPDSVVELKGYCFYSCDNLENIKIGTGLKTLDKYATCFTGTSNLKSFEVADGNSVYSNYGAILMNKNQTEIIKVPTAISGAVIIPEGVTYVTGFSDCTELTEITIPSSAIAISESCFKDCASLEKVNFTPTTSLKYIGNKVDGSIAQGGSAFSGCTSLTEIVIPDSVEKLYLNTFANCTALKTATLGTNINELRNNIFIGCTALETIYYNATSVTEDGSGVNKGFTGINSNDATNTVKLIVGSNVTSIPSMLYSNQQSVKTLISEIDISSATNLDSFVLNNRDGNETGSADVTLICGSTFNGKTITIPIGYSYTPSSENDVIGAVHTNSTKVTIGSGSGTAILKKTSGATITIIKKIPAVISFKDDFKLDKTYDGKAVSISENDYTLTDGAGDVTFSYQVKNGDTWADVKDVPTNAGTYRVKAVVAENDNYKGAETDWKEFTIGKATPAYTLPTDLTVGKGKTLATITFPNGFTWADETQTADELGTHEFKAVYTPEDTANYEVVDVMITVEVVPNTSLVNHAPEIEVSDKTLTVGDVFDPMENVIVKDKEDSANDLVVDVTHNVDTNKAGVYEVTYTVTDTKGATTIKKIYVTVNPKMEVLNEVPTINASDKTLTVGDTFNPLDGVTASDKEDGDITEKVEVLSNDVDTSKAGTYTVIYKVTDSKGASSTKTITVTVKGKDTQKPTIDDNKKPSATDTDKKPASTDKQTTSNSPKTGDSTNMTTWLALMFVSLGLLAGVFTVRKSRKSR